jgi:hypothetical protein
MEIQVVVEMRIPTPAHRTCESADCSKTVERILPRGAFAPEKTRNSKEADAPGMQLVRADKNSRPALTTPRFPQEITR